MPLLDEETEPATFQRIADYQPPPSWRTWLVGRPLRSADAPHQTIGKTIGLAVFASDNLSSTAYATDEILFVLATVGIAAFVYALPISLAIVMLLTILTFSYQQTIHAYPGGGGAYIVARDNLGELPAQTAGAALLTDYILTVSVSVASGVAQLTSAYPSLFPYRVILSVGFILFVMLINLRGVEHVLRAAGRQMTEVFGGQVAVLLPDPGGHLSLQTGLSAQFEMTSPELGVAQWVYEHRQMAGCGTSTLPEAKVLYLPLVASQGILGVLGLQLAVPRSLEAPEQLHQIETFANQTALALERTQLAEAAQEAQICAETERLRSSLLSSVSHDLRTPLATITGAASSLLEGDKILDDQTRKDLLESLAEEAERLNRLVNNLLEMTRLESGTLQVRKDWHVLEEVVGAALGRLAKLLRDRPVTTSLPADLPLVPIDDVLLEQVLINLLDNAVKHTPDGGPLEITARARNGTVTVEVADRGPGLPPGDRERVFDKFYRASGSTSRGAGLGLAICRGIVEAHSGRIWAENRPEGGVIFRFTLPLTGTPPELEGIDA